ncbi:PulJ/GspJ family protein, partial [Paraglaciecola hydrolytica]|uniref:PulJ/GspJ family protein n=1 Tax=Paraglaciecola hydrolytica TaxID=1799789 RepID=UPI00138F2888
MRKSKINWGFTLIEVLIALVIMTAVITISVGAFQMFNPANSDKDTNVLDRTVDLIGKQKMFRSLRAAQHYSTRDDSNTSFLVFMGEQN